MQDAHAAPLGDGSAMGACTFQKSWPTKDADGSNAFAASCNCSAIPAHLGHALGLQGILRGSEEDVQEQSEWVAAGAAAAEVSPVQSRADSKFGDLLCH